MLKDKGRLKFSQDAALDFVIEKLNPRRKLSYKLFEEQYGYDPLFDISIFPALIQLTEFLCGLQLCVISVGKWLFDSNVPFLLPLTYDELDYYCTNDEETKLLNGYKLLFKSIRFFPTDNMSIFQK